MVYSLTSLFDEYRTNIYLEGPEVENWNEFCQKYLDEAVITAFRLNMLSNEITWYDINNALVKVLEEFGYKRIYIPNFSNYETIKKDTERNLSSNLIDDIIEHNKITMNLWCQGYDENKGQLIVWGVRQSN